MTEEKRLGRQTPTKYVCLPYQESFGEEAVEIYNNTGRTAQEWQELLIEDLLGVNDDGLWTHTKFGYAVPRRNGKSEICIIRELYGLAKGEHILHTAHRTTTSHSGWERLCDALNKLGYKSSNDVRKDDGVPDNEIYDSYKSMGIESIVLRATGGKINFRTRSSKSGLGEGYDLLVIDEAQEYTDDQASALKYVVTDSKNPQTLFCGTPPTAVSAGTVFMAYRDSVLNGETQNAFWAEWSVDEMTNCRDVDAWYETNPSLGTVFTERSIIDEIGADEIDFNIQRLGLWLRYNQKSAISETAWEDCKLSEKPELVGLPYIGIKFAPNGNSVSLSLACKTSDNNIFVECIRNESTAIGVGWILDFLKRIKYEKCVIDGASGQQMLVDVMAASKLKKPVLPTVKEVITASSLFENSIYQHLLCHFGQPSLTQCITNAERRLIGSNGGYGFRSLVEDVDISLMESCVFAYWACATAKEKKKQKINY